MDVFSATAAFSALSQDARLETLRILVRESGSGMLAGELAQQLGMRQNTMSANLAVLLRANLIQNRREGRTIRYFVNFGTLRELISFILEDCCGGEPALCQSAIEVLIPSADLPGRDIF